ncbi:uncharacterized membrane protein DDB_G0293934 isoform X2 [Ooceraea biroi]|uniref:uncharacterized membrane protein DDB_G0293934 isoform X2 n=1 Tax=Ooceraea biroi TaxID=2015173 RepID=UPI0005B85C22|nr:uncharacterized membrane protein DDB_G0293934 isoform X2 [Ooceraea biroi]XP_011344724.1 uncharacterized membrane protein DDB_G0293934 isoform X2 [Ooceraea biroi]
MRCTILALTAVLCLALVNSHPLPEDGLRSEALDRLVMAEADSEAALRSKRTIGILRQLFPEISQRIEQKVNMIIAEIIRAVGPTLLRSFLGGRNNGGGSGSGGGTSVMGESPFGDDFGSTTGSNGARVSISLPDDEDEEEETETPNTSSSTSSTSTTTTKRSENVDVTTLTTLDRIRATTLPSQKENEVTTTL